ncbi:hypothetical protein FO519_000024 [Halicephalobus sp. NKZ332]|nr:hypothetical protein FO519_000024 [Halicephalobus sp. NKZ332]
MEALLKESGKFYNGLRIQTFCLLFTSVLLFASHNVVYELISLDQVVVDSAEDVKTSDEFKLMPLAHYLVYEMKSLSLPSQFAAKCMIQVGFYIGVLIGFCSCWVIFRLCRPKFILIGSIALNALLIFGNGFVPYFWSFVGARVLVGSTVAVGQTAVALLFLDWSHSGNQPLAIHHHLATRCFSLFGIAIMLHYSLPWRRFFVAHPCALIVAVFLDILFVRESPRWLRKNGKIEEFRNYYITLASSLGKREFEESEVFADDLISNDPSKKATMPSSPEIVELVVCYTLNALASLILQGSAGFYLSWKTEVLILAILQFLGAFLTTPFYSHRRIPLVTFTALAIMLTTLLIFLPHGIFYGTILQAAKFNAVLNDHFVLFFVMNICAPVAKDWRGSPARTRREWRARLLLGIETLATASRPLAVFFVLQKDDSIHKADRIPKLSLCIACYGLELFLIFAGYTFCSRRSVRNPDRENEKPLISKSLLSENPKPLAPPPATVPSPEEEETIYVTEGEIDIDI